jgi:hypothetical protein
MLALPGLSLGQANWSITGNATSTGSFVGTTNNQPLIFKVNNTEVARFKNPANAYIFDIANGLTVGGLATINNNLTVAGNTNLNNANIGGATTTNTLKLSKYAGYGISLLQLDNGGNVTPLVMGSAAQYLSGTGAWQTLPTNPTNAKLLSTNASGATVALTMGAATQYLNGLGAWQNFPLNAPLLKTDAAGNLLAFALGTSATQYLNGLGQWQTLPVAPTNPWLTVGNDVYKPTGNVGIGTQPSTFYKLDVIGDARISNNLYVGGGVVITDRVRATTEVQGSNFIVDNDLHVQNTAVFGGVTTFNGASAFNAPANFSNTLNAQSITANTLKFNNALLNSAGDTVITTLTNNGTRYIAYGGTPTIPKNNKCPIPYFSTVAQFKTQISINGFTNKSYDFFTDGFASFIETGFAGSNNITNDVNPLNINKYCLQDVLIDGKTSIGINAVSTNYGLNVTEGLNVTGGIIADTYSVADAQGNTTFNVKGNGTTQIGIGVTNAYSCALKIKAAQQHQGLDVVTNYTTDYGYNTKLWVNRDLTNALSVANTATGGYGITTFNVMGNGQTQIGAERQTTGPHAFDAMLSVGGKLVTQSCFVRTDNWADYVFESNYIVPNLYDVETYYKANKHLPEIPSECEVLEQGIDVAEMNKLLLKKIEEMTMQMVSMKKEIDNLKTK